jgi:hypothetical protein
LSAIADVHTYQSKFFLYHFGYTPFILNGQKYFWQLVLQFANDEDIPLDGTQSAEVLLARDTRPTGEALLEAAKQVCLS